MGAVLTRLLRFIPILLKYAVAYAPTVYELGNWGKKIYQQWRKKKPVEKDPPKEPEDGIFVDTKPDPG